MKRDTGTRPKEKKLLSKIERGITIVEEKKSENEGSESEERVVGKIQRGRDEGEVTKRK